MARGPESRRPFPPVLNKLSTPGGSNVKKWKVVRSEIFTPLVKAPPARWNCVGAEPFQRNPDGGSWSV
jgi:hypothetical protein